MASREVWGLDIGYSAIKAVRMRAVKGKKGKPVITAADYIPLKPASNTDEDRDNALRQALDSFAKKWEPRKDDFVLGVPGSTTLNRPCSLTVIDKNQLPEVVKYEAQQNIPFPLTDVAWDYHLLNPENFETGEDPRVMLFAVRREILFPYLIKMNTNRMNLLAVQTDSLAIYNFVSFELTPGETLVVLDIGAESTTLLIMDGSEVWMRTLPSGGNSITMALQKRLKLGYDEAESLKEKMAKSQHAKKIFEVLTPALRELVGEVHKSLGFYKSQHGGVKFSKILLTGAGSQLYGMARYLQNQLQLDVLQTQSFQSIDISPKAARVISGTRIPSFSSAIGLAIQGLGLGKTAVNFLPEELRGAQSMARKKPMYAVAAGLLGVAVALSAMKTSTVKKALKNDLKTYSTWKSQIASIEGEISSVSQTGMLKALEGRVRRIGTNNPGRVQDRLNSVLAGLSQNSNYEFYWDENYIRESQAGFGQDYTVYPVEEERDENGKLGRSKLVMSNVQVKREVVEGILDSNSVVKDSVKESQRHFYTVTLEGCFRTRNPDFFINGLKAVPPENKYESLGWGMVVPDPSKKSPAEDDTYLSSVKSEIESAFPQAYFPGVKVISADPLGCVFQLGAGGSSDKYYYSYDMNFPIPAPSKDSPSRNRPLLSNLYYYFRITLRFPDPDSVVADCELANANPNIFIDASKLTGGRQMPPGLPDYRILQAMRWGLSDEELVRNFLWGKYFPNGTLSEEEKNQFEQVLRKHMEEIKGLKGIQ